MLLWSVMPVVNAQDSSSSPKAKAQPASAPSVPNKSPIPKTNPAADKSRIEQQKALALSLLVSLANDARNFSDQKLRARTLSRIADALWEADPEQGRALFRKGWDAAEVADQDSARRIDEDRQRQQAADPNRPVARIQQPDLRAEVLRLAAGRDRALGEEFLDKLTEARIQEAVDAAAPSRTDPLDAPAAVKQRLRLANQLVESDIERALQFADPVLGTVTMEGIDFLSVLRDKNPAAADQRFAAQLATTAADLKSDANTISLLSSYLFTPHLFFTFQPDGGRSSSSINRPTPPPEVTPELRNAFLRVAAQVLLRPLPAREQDRSSAGLQGKFMVLKRLLPVFQQYAAKEIADQLRSEMEVLGQGVEEDVRDADDENPIQRGITPDRKAEDVEKSLLDRIDRAKTSEERDALYLQLATRLAQKGDMRARDFTEKIEDSELRKQAKPYVDMNLARIAVDKKEINNELLLASKGELTHPQRVWLLAQAAKSLPPGDRDRALEIINEATAEARRIDVSDADRPRALVAIANALFATDRQRAWEIMLEVAKASNSAEGFNGEDGRIMMQLKSKNMTLLQSSSVDDFNLPGIFRSLARDNATQAIEIARSFAGEAPRSSALIAVSRALLTEKAK
jgi:hypothetical protein